MVSTIEIVACVLTIVNTLVLWVLGRALLSAEAARAGLGQQIADGFKMAERHWGVCAEVIASEAAAAVIAALPKRRTRAAKEPRQ